MYPGDTLPDEEISLVAVGWIGGSWNKTTAEQVIAYVAGVDGELCPEESGNGGGVPYCGLFIQMLPGNHTLTIRLSHSASVSPMGFGSVTKRKQDYRELEVDLAPDTIYKLVPVRREGQPPDVALQEVCRGKSQTAMKIKFVERDASKDSGPECP
ncbi:hypothetical protein PPN31114_03486 [Pandoraea pneumonica]|uniref:Uncharacterized protein n=2 Tax=Pandoraea pneumonica TaxID=2508299 RepID=A0A5E4WT88_9BURK|nr:hypothetical protein PPN31114_03486 [Pandoraea pneumonica]